MNNCHKEPTWLVSNRLRPVSSPTMKTIFLGPYLSIAQPPTKVMMMLHTMKMEKTAEVVARLKTNSVSIDLKKTPKEKRIPHMAVLMIKKAATTTQP